MSSRDSNRLPPENDPQNPGGDDPELSVPHLNPEELAQANREKKLRAIQKAVEAGEYDDDDVLAEAMEHMRRSIQDDSDDEPRQTR